MYYLSLAKKLNYFKIEMQDYEVTNKIWNRDLAKITWQK